DGAAGDGAGIGDGEGAHHGCGDLGEGQGLGDAADVVAGEVELDAAVAAHDGDAGGGAVDDGGAGHVALDARGDGGCAAGRGVGCARRGAAAARERHVGDDALVDVGGTGVRAVSDDDVDD